MNGRVFFALTKLASKNCFYSNKNADHRFWPNVIDINEIEEVRIRWSYPISRMSMFFFAEYCVPLIRKLLYLKMNEICFDYSWCLIDHISPIYFLPEILFNAWLTKKDRTRTTIHHFTKFSTDVIESHTRTGGLSHFGKTKQKKSGDNNRITSEAKYRFI